MSIANVTHLLISQYSSLDTAFSYLIGVENRNGIVNDTNSVMDMRRMVSEAYLMHVIQRAAEQFLISFSGIERLALTLMSWRRPISRGWNTDVTRGEEISTILLILIVHVLGYVSNTL